MKKVILVVPVYNEEKILEDSIVKLYDYLKKNIKYDWKIIIANNASKDNTKMIADKLSKKYPKVKTLHLDVKGRGNALKKAWTKYPADCYSYCDADLATDVSHIKELFDSIIEEKNNASIGNRYLKGSETKRTLDRWIYSKIYIVMVKILFRTKITDTQCGFKAFDKKIIEKLLPNVKDNEFFFDTELLLKAENMGYKIKQIPVKWNEMRKKDSKVNIPDTICKYIKKIIELKKEL
jgi:glycosyltransferase involved in cell wall biosynthesis